MGRITRKGDRSRAARRRAIRRAWDTGSSVGGQGLSPADYPLGSRVAQHHPASIRAIVMGRGYSKNAMLARNSKSSFSRRDFRGTAAVAWRKEKGDVTRPPLTEKSSLRWD